MAPELSSLGIAHTLCSLAAIGFALFALTRQGSLRINSGDGKAYAVLTALTAVTALGIHQRGNFGPG